MQTLEEARRAVLHGREEADGIICPCCDQLSKVYRRPLNSAMARGLVSLIDVYLENGGSDWVNVHELDLIQGRRGGGDFAKLRFFGLIKEKPKPRESDPDQRSSGFWKPTKKGYRFIRRRLSVPRAVFLYDDVPIRYDKRKITIEQALGKKYRYSEIMRATRNLGAKP
jgi:hypothetical protein